MFYPKHLSDLCRKKNALSPSVHAAKTNIDFIFSKLEEDGGSMKHSDYCHTLCRSLQDDGTVGVLQGCLDRRISPHSASSYTLSFQQRSAGALQ